jgi:hypothetical protein
MSIQQPQPVSPRIPADGTPTPPRRKIFVIRPWHDQSSSLYPHIMDGVEYIDGVIDALRASFPPKTYELRVDTEVFVPGESLRANVAREITDAEIVLVLLDGLRPNVVYELGIAHALQARLGSNPGDGGKRVIPIAEANATVLVRNFYPSPLRVPMRDGSINTPLNPPLDLSAAWSDGSDILVHRYDRLNLAADIRTLVLRTIQRIVGDPAKGTMVADAAMEDDEDLTSVTPPEEAADVRKSTAVAE